MSPYPPETKYCPNCKILICGCQDCVLYMPPYGCKACMEKQKQAGGAAEKEIERNENGIPYF